MLNRYLRPFAVCALALALPAQDGASPKPAGAATPPAHTVPAPLAGALPELNAQSSWVQNTRYEGAHPDKTERGVYPVGNGRVFTYMGLGERANPMMALTAPSYAAAEPRLPRGHFGELTLDLAEIDLPNQKVRRVTGANFVVTSDATTSGLALRTLTFAEPGKAIITRVITVTNGAKQAAKGVKLVARLTGGKATARKDGLLKRYTREGHDYHAVFALGKGRVGAGTLSCDVGDLAPGASFQTVLTIRTGRGEAPAERPATDLAIATDAAKNTIAWWKAKLAPMPAMKTDDARIMDLFADWKILMLTMRDAHSGVVSPMVTRRGAWIRESTGPILVFLRFNMWDEARALLEYFYNAIRLTGEVRERYPLDLEFTSLAGKQTDWDSIRWPESDLLSWIVLQHFWYFRATRDAAFVKERREFLVACLSKQKRTEGSLMRFSGHENYMNPTLYTLDIDAMERNPRFIAEDAAHDRRSFSLASSVLYLCALQGMGDIDNGIEQMDDPEKWNQDPSEVEDKPSQKWLERSLPVMHDIEKHYWLAPASFPVRDDVDPSFKQYGDDWQGFFAPALSPVNGEKHDEPIANINLLPLWVGFTFPSGERSRHNLRNTLARLWHRKDADGKRVGALIGTTSTVGHFTGDVPGMLLTALVERDGIERYDAYADLLRIAEPAGEWGQFYNPDGRPIASDDPEWPHRLSPNACGINVDAAIFALNGIRHVNIANFDNSSIKLKLRLPRGAKYLNMNNLKKDGRAFNVHVDEYWAPLNADERRRNDAQKNPRFKRDPNIDHRRFRFRMELLSDNPTWGAKRYQVDADVCGTMFVDYVFRGVRDGKSGILQNKEFWKDEYSRFFLDDSPTTEPKPRELKLTPNATMIVFTNRSQCATILGERDVTYVDTGLPLAGPEIVRALLKDGKPTHPKLYLDVGYDAADRRTFKPKRFFGKHWTDLLQRYRSAGGEVMRPQFVTKFEVRKGEAWTRIDAPEGRLQLPTAAAPQLVRFEFESASARENAVLRIGSSGGYKVRCNGAEVTEGSDTRLPIRDQDAALIELKKGTNELEVELAPGTTPTLFVRITDPRGLPLAGR